MARHIISEQARGYSFFSPNCTIHSVPGIKSSLRKYIILRIADLKPGGGRYPYCWTKKNYDLDVGSKMDCQSSLPSPKWDPKEFSPHIFKILFLMSTSFSTIRSSNCWILKSFRLKAVLHSGQAAEGLVNNTSTQFSHLATHIQVSFVRSWERTKQTHFLIWRENTLIKTTWSQIWINVQNASNFSWNLESMKFKKLTICDHTHLPKAST